MAEVGFEPSHLAAGTTRLFVCFFFLNLPVFSASSTAVKNTPQRSLCSAMCGGAARLRSQSLERLKQEQGCEFKVSPGYCSKTPLQSNSNTSDLSAQQFCDKARRQRRGRQKKGHMDCESQ